MFVHNQIMVKEKGWKIGIVVGIILIISTVSLMTLPFENEVDGESPVEIAFEKMESSENKLLNFIDKEKADLSAKMNHFSYP